MLRTSGRSQGSEDRVSVTAIPNRWPPAFGASVQRRFSSALSGPGRPRLSQRERASREIQRHKARLAELGVIEKAMGREEVEALNAQIDALIARDRKSVV